jgi:transposase-like protein
MEIKAITRQHRATADQRMRMIEQYRRSGLTRAAFSRQYGVPLPTLGYWLMKANRALNLPVPVVFSEVNLTAPEASTNAWAMEVVAPSGLTIRCREALAVRDLARLLRG